MPLTCWQAGAGRRAPFCDVGNTAVSAYEIRARAWEAPPRCIHWVLITRSPGGCNIQTHRSLAGLHARASAGGCSSCPHISQPQHSTTTTLASWLQRGSCTRSTPPRSPRCSCWLPGSYHPGWRRAGLQWQLQRAAAYCRRQFCRWAALFLQAIGEESDGHDVRSSTPGAAAAVDLPPGRRRGCGQAALAPTHRRGRACRAAAKHPPTRQCCSRGQPGAGSGTPWGSCPRCKPAKASNGTTV